MTCLCLLCHQLICVQRKLCVCMLTKPLCSRRHTMWAFDTCFHQVAVSHHWLDVLIRRKNSVEITHTHTDAFKCINVTHCSGPLNHSNGFCMWIWCLELTRNGSFLEIQPEAQTASLRLLNSHSKHLILPWTRE